MTVWTKICLVYTCQYFKKYYFENSVKKPSLALALDSFTEHNNYLLELTWQTDNGWYSPVFDDFFIEFINIRPVYIREWVGWAWGWGGWWQRLVSKVTQIAGFRVAITSKCIHKMANCNIPLQGLDGCVLTVGAISGPHWQIGALHWHHFTSHEFTWSTKSTLEKQTSWH